MLIKVNRHMLLKFFGDRHHIHRNHADENEWQEMLVNATSEEYIMVDVIVNGTKFQKVGIRLQRKFPSLSQVASQTVTVTVSGPAV